ncbi:MAG TPA: acyl-CoA dehydrogenase [Chitinophaga sp.]
MTHPSALLPIAFTHTIRTHAAQAEALRQLHPAQLELLYAQHWLKAAVPAIYGGLEYSLPQLVALEEAIGWADGSMGWVFTLCAGAGWFGGFMEPSFAARIFSDPTVCLAGSGAITGTAIRENGGYRVTGNWRYASGVKHATVFTANCNLAGTEEVLTFAFLRSEVTLQPTWHTLGMVATGSDSFSVNDMWIPEERRFRIDAAAARVDSPLYRFPFLQLAEATLAANMAGMALHFLDEAAVQMAARTHLTTAQQQVMDAAAAQATQALSAHRAALHTAAEQAWQACVARPAIATGLLDAISHRSRALARTALQQVDRLYPYCGMAAADPGTALNRVWRDLHTASQHALLTFDV